MHFFLPGNRPGSKYNGIFVEPGNYSQLANAILYLYKNKKLRDKFGSNANLTVNRKYTWKIHTSRILEKADNKNNE